MTKRFCNSYLTKEKDGFYVSYRSGMLNYEEKMFGGVLTSSALGISGYPVETSTVPSVPRPGTEAFLLPQAFFLEVNGIGIEDGYVFDGFDSAGSNGSCRTELKLKNENAGLTVTVVTELDGTDTLTRSLFLKNDTDRPIPFTKIAVFGGGLTQGHFKGKENDFYRLGYMHNSWGANEGDYHAEGLARGEFAFSRQRYSDRFRIPFFTLESKPNGIVFVGSLAHSGAYRMRFSHENYYGTSALSFRCEIGAGPYPLVLKPDETFTTPVFHFCATAGSTDDAINEMNDHIRLYAAPFKKEGLLESGIGPETDMSEEMILHAIDTAEKLGAEVFFIDASWYAEEHGERDWPSRCGNWDPKPFRYRRSMLEIREYAKNKGLKFGLWADPEKIGYKSEIWDSAVPPRLHDRKGAPVLDGNCRIVDASVPDGAKWLDETIRSILDRYQLDFFRLDSGSYAFTAVMDSCGYSENRDLRYYDAWYKIFRKLRNDYPDVIFQNCAGGGARIDTGMVTPMSNTWITDQQIAPTSYRVLNGVSMILPCEYFVRGVGGQNVQVAASLDFQLNVARFGNPVCSYNTPVGLSMNDRQLTAIRNMLDTYKNVVRPHLPGCRVYHHTPEIYETAPDSVGILELGSAERDFSMLGVFTLTRPEDPEIRVRFRGIDPDGQFRVTCNDRFTGVFRGYELVENGITVRIENALDSRVYIAEKMKG